MLYDPACHEPLSVLPWDEDRARATIELIAEEFADGGGFDVVEAVGELEGRP